MTGSVQDTWFSGPKGNKTETSRYGVGARWRVRYMGEDGRERSKVFRRKVDADKFLNVQVSRLNRGDWVDPAAGKTTFAKVAAVWLARPDIRQSTRERDRSYLDSMVLPRLGVLPVGRITPDDIDTLVRDLADEGKASATIRKAAQITGAVLEDAVRRELIPRSPARGVRLPAVEQEEMVFLGVSDLMRLCDQLGKWRGVGLLGAFGGLRFGEVAGLRPDDIDIDGKTVSIKRTASDLLDGVKVGPPKTKTAIRTVALPQFVIDELEGRTGRYLYTDSVGGPLARRNWTRRVWKPALVSANLPDLRFHDLRHSHVAMLIGMDENPKTIAARLGHKSVRTVLDVYGHLYADADSSVATELEKLVGV